MPAISALVLAAAKTVGVPGALLLAICTHETKLNDIVVPHDGGSASIGICQVKADTARSMGYTGRAYTNRLRRSEIFPGTLEPVGKPTGLLDPRENALYAAKYLRSKLDLYGGDWCKATAAYNAGKYNPSKVAPGKPRNYMYIKRVVLELDDENKDYLVCGARKVRLEVDSE